MATRRWNNETEVNAVTAGFQEDARVAALAGGGFVVAWRNASGVGASGISARIFDTLGRPVSTELAVATGSASTFHDAPDVAALPDGGFQVVWTTTAIAENGAVTGSNVVGRVFTASGAPVRDITVTEVQAGRFDDSVAIAPFGPNLALVFQTTAGDGPLLRVLDPTGAGGPPIPSGFVARVLPTRLAVAAVPDGARVAVAWANSAINEVRLQLHGDTGVPLGESQQVAVQDAESVPSQPAVAWISPGLFAVAWTRNSFNGFLFGDVMMRFYSSASVGSFLTPSPIGPAFQVNGTSAGAQGQVSLTPTRNGGVVAAWTDSNSDDTGISVRLQAFDGTGNRIGGEYRVSVEENGLSPDIAALADGRVVVTWHNTVTAFDDPALNDIRAQIIDPRQGVVTGGNTADTLYGNDLVGDEMRGLGGNDLYVIGPNDIVQEEAGGGTDTVQSTLVNVDLSLLPHVENATLSGAVALKATGNAGANTLSAAGNSAPNILTGLGGDDLYVLGVGDTAIEAPGGGTDTVQTAAVDLDLASFPHVENITLTGALALKATGNSGDNTLSGANNSAGNTLAGLGGNDTYVVGSGDVVVEAPGAGLDTVLTSVSYTLAPGAAVEFLRNNTIATGLTLTGNALSQTVAGAGGNDTLASGGGFDVLIGHGGTDSLTGGGGAGHVPLPAAQRQRGGGGA